ncbi:MAG: uroporphyrinogen-III synthase [Bryobacteraceae bacterium]|nr:uroporphyrinogen-III synthase [Bryobacteraceae bacterium]MDW8379416.1 uroporphyrinogen-III synthase [Bryobacterales bacterium]
MGFDGLRVVAFESRRAAEMATLIRNQGGEAFVAPSMREAPLEDHRPTFEFAERLFAGEFDMMIFLTGVGTRALNQLLATRYPEKQFAEALRQIAVAARGPKPVAALREMGVPVAVTAPEPNTWRELLQAMKDRPERRLAVQEYGRPNPELLAALRARGAQVTPVRVYRWALPHDTAPLRLAVRRLAAGDFDVALFTTAIQVPHMMQIASEEGVEAQLKDQLRSSVVVGSVGPSCSEMLEEYGLPTDISPSHPKMGFLVKETAERARQLLRSKRK